MFKSKKTLLATVGVALTLLVLGSAPVALAQDDRPPQKHALVIGVNRYIAEIENVPQLQFAVPDAERIGEILDERGWDARRVTDEYATRDRIVRELSRLARETKQQDSVLIYFAGHGVVDKTGRDHTYWLTYTATWGSLAVHGIRLTHLLEYVQDIPASRKLVLLDHCHSGDVEKIIGVAAGGGLSPGSRAGVGELQVTRNLFPTDDFKKEVKGRFGEGLAILGAARNAAYEFEDLGHGMFTHGLIEALTKPGADTNKDNFLSLNEIWTHTKTKLQEITTQKGITQEPIDLVLGAGMLDWNVIDAPGLAPDRIARDLEKVINEIDQTAGLNIRVKAACFQAVGTWKDARLTGGEPPPADAQIVEELRGIGTLGTQISWTTKKNMLESKLEALGVVR